MFERLTNKPYLVLGLGLMTGLLFGLGMTIGVLVGLGSRGGVRLELPETLLHATATHGGDTMAIATGPIDESTEGLFVLDFLTGELQCAVLNPHTMQLGGLYRHNVIMDLGVEQNKQSRYLMVTGAINARVSGGRIRPAQSIVYVADTTTGRFAAYMLPWDRAAASYNFAQANPMILLGKGAARKIQIE